MTYNEIKQLGITLWSNNQPNAVGCFLVPGVISTFWNSPMKVFTNKEGRDILLKNTDVYSKLYKLFYI